VSDETSNSNQTAAPVVQGVVMLTPRVEALVAQHKQGVGNSFYGGMESLARACAKHKDGEDLAVHRPAEGI